MKSVAVVLSAAICLLLVVGQGQSLSVKLTSHDADQAIVEKHMMEDLADLLEVKKEQQSQPSMDEYKLKPGQIILKCSNYEFGCCQDGKTLAKGPNKKGCGEALCVDNSVGYCEKNRKRLDCTRGSVDFERCTYTCGCPKKPASRLDECKQLGSKFGCCWNGVPAFTLSHRDCPPCRDLTVHTCRQFKNISRGCASGSYGIRTFMQKYCPRTCGACYMK